MHRRFPAIFSADEDNKKWPSITTRHCNEVNGICLPLSRYERNQFSAFAFVAAEYTEKKTAYSQLVEESEYGREHTDGENRKLVVDPKHKN